VLIPPILALSGRPSISSRPRSKKTKGLRKDRSGRRGDQNG